MRCASPPCGGNSGDSPPPSTGPDTATRNSAATSTAQNNAACTAIRPFYWEIGDRSQRLAGASVNQAGNATTYAADTEMAIASASKWLYGAYVAERRSGMLTPQDIQFLTFTSGYPSFAAVGDCFASDTVAECVVRGSNDVQTPAHVGQFLYNGGHMRPQRRGRRRQRIGRLRRADPQGLGDGRGAVTLPPKNRLRSCGSSSPDAALRRA
ncbi:MAG: hypothetical protein H7Z15_23395 [Rhizobacter sp.]|nr:hypothetical protein [Rhizobacter sp.]